MAISFNSALGIHEQALYLREQRSTVLANNLANADTPNFKARDVDFTGVLERASAALAARPGGNAGADQPRRTDARHLSLDDNGSSDLMYRTPSQPAIDGNTVEEHAEMSRFAKNGMDFEASMYFLSGKFRGLKSAIKGEVA